MAEPGQVLDSRYRLDTHIAAGGMGEVWRGTDLALNRAVAVKLLHPEHASRPDGLARFRAEAQHAGSLSHPNIAQVYDYCEPVPPEPAYLVMELVDGPSLARYLDDGPLSPARTLDVIEQAASGLAAAHRSGLLHRDIKPGNLLMSRDGLMKITDFGIARPAGSAGQTRTGALAGTPAYLAPERFGGAPATPATDLYALGVVAHQCLTGQVPFAGEPLVVALAHVERDMPPLPASVPAELAALVADLTRKDPQHRPVSAIAVLARAGLVRAAVSGSAATSFAGTSAADGGPAGHTRAWGITDWNTPDWDTNAAAGGAAAAWDPAAARDDAAVAGGGAATGDVHDGRDVPGHHARPWRSRGRAPLALAGLAAAGLVSVVIWLLTSDPGPGTVGHRTPSRAPAAQQASPRHSSGPHQIATAHHGRASHRGQGAHPGAGHRRHGHGRGHTQPSPTVSPSTPSAGPTPTEPAATPTPSAPAPTPSASVSGNAGAPSAQLALNSLTPANP